MEVREDAAKFVVAMRADCRKAMRTALRLAVRAKIHPPPGCESDTSKSSHVLTQDLSGDAISIVYSKQLCVGQRIDLELPDRFRSCVVCRAKKMEDGHYLIVCRCDESDG
jgi:hypothetical protein